MIAAKKPAKSGGAPAWMVTFADLMSLLLTLFVLLLSFSTMETQRFKDLAGHLRNAFGFQTETLLLGVIEKGGTPEYTELSKVDPASSPEILLPAEQGEQQIGEDTTAEKAASEQAADKRFAEQNLETFERLKTEMSNEIDSALVDVLAAGDVVIVRFPDQVSFISGRADLLDQFYPVMEKITGVLESAEGHIVISGHTDDIPIHTERYRSNWDLSTARAVSVAHYILDNTTISPDRITVQGYADSRPLVANTSAVNRAKNRRVEIMIQRADTGPPQPQNPEPENPERQSANP